MNFEVVYTDNFKRELKHLFKKYRSIKKDLEHLITTLEKTPAIGTPIGKDCFKIRLKIESKRKGKSGGGRVITHLHIHAATVYLLTIYDKSEQENILDKQLETLLKHIR